MDNTALLSKLSRACLFNVSCALSSTIHKDKEPVSCHCIDENIYVVYSDGSEQNVWHYKQKKKQEYLLKLISNKIEKGRNNNENE